MSADRRLPTPEPGRWAAEAFVAEHLGHLTERRRSSSESPSSSVFRGGQTAADAALARFTIDGYARGRLEAYPQPRRTVSRLSPWIRHGLLPLPRLWEGAADQKTEDGLLFRSALLRQEYARHWYARLGALTRSVGSDRMSRGPGRRADDRHEDAAVTGSWDRRLGCLEITLDELEEDGWLPEPARRWLASHRIVREGHGWREGEDYFHRHLLDGSRAAGRLGWLQVSGVGADGPVGFSRWDVEERAPGLCASCELVRECPIERWPASVSEPPSWEHPLLYHDPTPDLTAGPIKPVVNARPQVVWLTAESLGDADPALTAHPDLPVLFVFDEPILEKLRLSSTRLSFLVETLGDLATRRTVEIWLGDPVAVVAGRGAAVTFTPVPGWRRRSAAVDVAAVHPWPWMYWPHVSRIDSFGFWFDGLPSTMNGSCLPTGDLPQEPGNPAGRSVTKLV